MERLYIKVDAQNCVTAYADPGFELGSDAILAEFDEEIGNGLELLDERSVWRYKLEAGRIVKRTQEEMDADWIKPDGKPTIEQRVTTLEQKVDGELADQQEALRILGL